MMRCTCRSSTFRLHRATSGRPPCRGAAPGISRRTLRPRARFPVDDWLHGVARVREKVRDLRAGRLLADVVRAPRARLWPVQLPSSLRAVARRSSGPTRSLCTATRLLYTAHYPSAFDATAAQAGLLLDEWVEVVPGDTTTTGVVFHYDSPDTEPPQAMLLVVPPRPRGGMGSGTTSFARCTTRSTWRGCARVEPDRVGRHALRGVPAGDGIRGDGPRTRHLRQSRAQQPALQVHSSAVDGQHLSMIRQPAQRAAASGSSRSVTIWNRLEGRPRSVDFTRALRAEVRDALWMLTRQWQMGEFARRRRGLAGAREGAAVAGRARRFQARDTAVRHSTATRSARGAWSSGVRSTFFRSGGLGAIDSAARPRPPLRQVDPRAVSRGVRRSVAVRRARSRSMPPTPSASRTSRCGPRCARSRAARWTATASTSISSPLRATRRGVQ